MYFLWRKIGSIGPFAYHLEGLPEWYAFYNFGTTALKATRGIVQQYAAGVFCFSIRFSETSLKIDFIVMTKKAVYKVIGCTRFQVIVRHLLAILNGRQGKAKLLNEKDALYYNSEKYRKHFLTCKYPYCLLPKNNCRETSWLLLTSRPNSYCCTFVWVGVFCEDTSYPFQSDGKRFQVTDVSCLHWRCWCFSGKSWLSEKEMQPTVLYSLLSFVF